MDGKLLEIFNAEQQEHLQRIRFLLDQTAGGPGLTGPALEEVCRRVHTLKGAARAVGIGSIELLSHRAEAIFARVREQTLALGGPAMATVRHVLESAEDILASVLENRAEPEIGPVLQAIEGVLSGVPDSPGAATPASGAEAGPVAGERAGEQVRVSAATVDDLIRSSSQVLAASAGQERVSRQVSDLCHEVAGLDREWTRLRERSTARLRRLEAEPELAPVAEWFELIDNRLRALASRARAADAAQQRSIWTARQLGSQVYADACRVRMIAAEEVFDPFHRMVRELAREENKEIEFRMDGLDVQADRVVLQRLKDPVMHLLRNAVSHGIESAGERLAAGKPAAGVVELRLESRGDRLNLTVADDGRGIDLHQVAEAAVEQGLITREAAGSLSPREVVKLVFRPGLSTSRAVTRLSGRGMGLPVVEDQVVRLQGEVSLHRNGGCGTSVVLSVPLSISTRHVLLVACGGHTFGIPAAAVERLCRIRPGDIENVDGSEAIRVDGEPVFLAKLSAVLGLPEAAGALDGEERRALPVAVLRSGEQRAALVVDALVDEREAVVKDLGLSGGAAGMSFGGVPLEDGSVAVVLNPPAVLERFRQAERTTGLKTGGAGAEKKTRLILVVDDSITTRSLEKSILEAHGYRVRVAVDGVEALAELRAEPADLVIADIMMPRMDGFQLVENIKSDRLLAHIPVILVTSLERREDQERGLSLGADSYIVKRKFDQRELLNTVRQIL